MANFPILKTGQQAVGITATALPSLAATPGDGLRVILEALKANTVSMFYGVSGVTIGTGKELPPGAQDILFVNNLNQIFVISGPTGGSVSWVVTAPAGV